MASSSLAARHWNINNSTQSAICRSSKKGILWGGIMLFIMRKSFLTGWDQVWKLPLGRYWDVHTFTHSPEGIHPFQWDVTSLTALTWETTESVEFPILTQLPECSHLGWDCINPLNFVFHWLPPLLMDQDCGKHFNKWISKLQQSSLVKNYDK